MDETWKLQDAKNRFSEVVERAMKKEPQIVTRRGKKVVVVLAVEDYERLVAPRGDLVDFLGRSPLRGVDLDLERSVDGPREVDP